MKPQRIDGQLYDIPAAEYNFYHYDSHRRHMASHRAHHRARLQTGEVFWTHPFIPNRGFPTRIAALRAALETMAVTV